MSKSSPLELIYNNHTGYRFIPPNDLCSIICYWLHYKPRWVSYLHFLLDNIRTERTTLKNCISDSWSYGHRKDLVTFFLSVGLFVSHSPNNNESHMHIVVPESVSTKRRISSSSSSFIEEGFKYLVSAIHFKESRKKEVDIIKETPNDMTFIIHHAKLTAELSGYNPFGICYALDKVTETKVVRDTVASMKAIDQVGDAAASKSLQEDTAKVIDKLEENKATTENIRKNLENTNTKIDLLLEKVSSEEEPPELPPRNPPKIITSSELKTSLQDIKQDVEDTKNRLAVEEENISQAEAVVSNMPEMAETARTSDENSFLSMLQEGKAKLVSIKDRPSQGVISPTSSPPVEKINPETSSLTAALATAVESRRIAMSGDVGEEEEEEEDKGEWENANYKFSGAKGEEGRNAMKNVNLFEEDLNLKRPTLFTQWEKTRNRNLNIGKVMILYSKK